MSVYELDAWVEGYLDYLRDVRRLANGTIRDARCSLRGICRFLNEQCDGRPVYKVRLEDTLRWINHIRDQGRTNQNIAKNLSHLRGLLDYAWRSGRTDRNVLDGFNMKPLYASAAPPLVLTIEQAKALVLACSARTQQQRRDRLVILLLYGCGLRSGECCQLDIKDVDIERQELFVRKAKGDQQRTVPVPPGVWTELLAYLAEQSRRRGALFRTSSKKTRISIKDLGAIVRGAAGRAGLESGVLPKTLRHSFATHLMERGVDIGVISSLMGHRSPSETGVYLHTLGDKRVEAVQSLSERGMK